MTFLYFLYFKISTWLPKAPSSGHNLPLSHVRVRVLFALQIPNPLFDLAGIICGMYQVPFATFFFATLIGKSVVKMHLQMLTVVYLFVDVHFNSVVDKFRYYSYYLVVFNEHSN